MYSQFREDTIDLRAEAEEHGEYTEQLVSVQREASPELTSGQIKSKTSRPGRYSSLYVFRTNTDVLELLTLRCLGT